jgi:hypothetical protein
MKKSIMRIMSTILAIALVLACSVTALAADDKGVSVVLDGQTISFTDATPRNENGHVMLPLRAVLEAMGGTVSSTSDATTTTVTGTLNGATLTMTAGSTEATITKDGVTSTIYMDVAPYVDIAKGRTFVPVRFAAEAFGCKVGWDQTKQSVIIVDVDKLVAQAVSKNQYTMLQKFSDYSASVKSQNLSTTGNLNLAALMLGQSLLSMDCDFSGVTASQTAVQATYTMNMDLSGLMTMIGATPSDLGLTSTDGKMAMNVEVRADMASGTFYLLFDDATDALLNLEPGTWLSMNMDEMLAYSGTTGMNWSDLMAQKFDFSDCLTLVSSLLTLDSNSDTAYQSFSAEVNQLAAAFSDSAFTKTSTGYVDNIPVQIDGTTGTCSIALTTNASDAITGYSVTADMAIPSDFISEALGADTVSSLSMLGGMPENLTLKLTMSQSAAGASTMDLSVNLGTIASLTMNMDAQTSPATTAPLTTPPAGATVIPFTDLIGLSS